jgi:lipopolysaccharide exporter
MKSVAHGAKLPLRHRVVRAGIWTTLLRGVARGSGFARNVVLARLLAPDDFGVFGIALVVLSIVERLSNPGLEAALVQKDCDVREYLDTVWTIQVIRGAFFCGLLVVAAAPIAGFLGDVRASPFIYVLGVVVWLRSLHNPGMVLYQRELEASYQFQYRTCGAVVELAVSISLALLLRSAWALAFGLLAGRITLLCATYVLHPYRPRVRLRWQQLRELGRYGRWVFLGNVLFFLAYRGDNLIVGKFLGAPALGVYLLAYSISEVVTVEIGRITREIAFPAYSRMQADIWRVRNAFTLGLDLVASVAFPVAAVLALMAGPLTHVILGPRWSGVAAVLPPLALAGSLRAVIGNGTAAFSALGHPSLAFRTDLVAVAATYLVMLPLANAWGLPGVAVAVAAGLIVALVPFVVFARRVLAISPKDLARHLLPAAALVVIVGATTAGANELLGEYSARSLAAVMAVILLTYATTSALLWIGTRKGPVSALMFLRSAKSRPIA